MALDTRGLGHGFAQGFQVMNSYQRGKKQDERAERGLQMREEQFEMQKEQAAKQQEQQQAQFVLGKIASGIEPTEDEVKWLADNRKYWPALDPQTDQDIEVAQRVIDPEDPMSANDPDALYSINHLFDHRINRGSGGKKRVAGLYPGAEPGTVALDLEVEGEDGAIYNAPLTANRGTEAEGDDEVMQVPVGGLVEQVQGYRVLRNAIRSGGGQEMASRVLSVLTGKTPERTKGIQINDRLVNPETGEVMADFSQEDQSGYSKPFKHEELGWVQTGPDGKLYQYDPEDGGGRGGSGSAPADVQTAEWMMRVGLAENYDQAWSLLNESRTDPTRFVANYVDQEMKAQEQAGIYPGMEGYKTTEQMRNDALEALRTIRQSTRGTGQGQPGLDTSGQGQAYPPGGRAVDNGDGSYSGRVDRSPQTPTVRSDADYDRLPPGTVFVDEEGNQYRKPAE
ncbi:MAG: hypothetical protein AWU57_449 [Marinobacter sp. T13-3]|nr:MAG: hypothetical protein AWU57_449 [Marinobacter sp. T13-3]